MTLLLAACGSSPSKPEAPAAVPAQSAPPPALTTTAVTTPVVETASALATKPSKATAVPVAATVEGAPVEAPIPPQAQQQFDAAVASMSSGNHAAAEQAFRSLSTAYPLYAGPLLNLGILQTKAGKLEDAATTLGGAIERSESAAAFNQLGMVYRRLGRFKEADAAYQRALQIDPNYAFAHLNLGVLCDLYLQQPQRALEAFERYQQLVSAPDAKVNAWIAELKSRLGSQQRSARAD